jgi:hypothetical protein
VLIQVKVTASLMPHPCRRGDQHRISPAWKIDVYAVKGFATGSPAVAGGIIVTWQHKF